jgi:hypothetical protein
MKKRNHSREGEKTPRTKNSKHEIRNSKQSQMAKIGKIPNKLPSDSAFWIFPIGNLPVSSLFRISIFGFRICFRGRLGAMNQEAE